ncbi:nuclear transport factor 2 family protein [Uliginosibacterium aquaticum]|uniref:Nuclear transport factor 2 family protein n=1 Tax=Uliginosibacterium aquaticum TaxID=2731212 RepID=A0ABX2IBS1_9RHOO|nr:nuclear transport factor 2 family protein [Uliginosibacterium aquaticum]NSL53915.1 nuclear transport factor 2 family protein [Uliginosibacterium aquaticum]
MNSASKPGTQPSAEIGRQAGELVEEFLRIIMIPDPEGARAFTAPDMRIRFTGGRDMKEPADCSAFNAGRYAWVKKRFERTDVVAGATAEEAIVYNIGTLYGAWPDGTPFEGNRYVDRYVVSQGKIVEMQVWNDSAEWLLVRAGLAPAWPSPMGGTA